MHDKKFLKHLNPTKGRKFKFITNNWDITPEEVALIYKYRWSIELTFK
ncbi:MAG: transposase [Bacteroidales bacterium]|jgi:IS4 transposase|nr:transposase [Bacteroidales bacterium]